MLNWTTLYKNAPPKLKSFMKLIPAEDLNNMDLEEAAAYVKRQYAMKQIEKERVRLDPGMTDAENTMKFDLFKNRETAKYHHKPEYAITNTSEKISKDILYTLLDLPKTLQPLVNFASLTLPKRYILLDSRNRNLSRDNYTWDLVHFSNTQQGQCNTVDIITQILEIRCHPFRIPILQNASYYKKIRVGIREFATQGVEIARNDLYSTRNSYHFDCTAVVSGNYLEVTPVDSWRPGKVIAQCDRISLDFYGNTEKLQMPTDRMTCTYPTGTPVTVTTSDAHDLVTGDLVYFNDGDLRNEYGWLIAVTGANTFIVNTTSAGGSTTVYFASKRIQIQFDFICLENA